MSIVSKIWEDLQEDARQLALRKIGPLAHLVGIWKGSGYAIISRPDANNGKVFKFQQNRTIEEMSFIPLIVQVRNRSSQPDQIESLIPLRPGTQNVVAARIGSC
jgi:hypothetical protein